VQELRDEYRQKSHHSYKDPETGEEVILDPPSLVQDVLGKWRAQEDLMARLDVAVGVSGSARPHRSASRRAPGRIAGRRHEEDCEDDSSIVNSTSESTAGT